MANTILPIYSEPGHPVTTPACDRTVEGEDEGGGTLLNYAIKMQTAKGHTHSPWTASKHVSRISS